MNVIAANPEIASVGSPLQPSRATRIRRSNVSGRKSPTLSQGTLSLFSDRRNMSTISSSSTLRTSFAGDRTLIARKNASGASVRNGPRRPIVLASTDGDPGLSDGAKSEHASTSKPTATDTEALQAALQAAESRAIEAEKAKCDAIEALSISEAKAQEYAVVMMQTTEEAVAELEEYKNLFKSELKTLLENKSLELMLAKQDAVNLAISVEKIAESVARDATQSISEDVTLKSRTAETAAAEAALRMEEGFYNATADTAALLIKEASSALNRAMASAAVVQEQTDRLRERPVEAFDQLAAAKTMVASLQGTVSLLEQKLYVSEKLAENLRSELADALKRIDKEVGRVERAEALVKEVRAAADTATLQQEESIRLALESIRSSKSQSSDSSGNADFKALSAAYAVAQETANVMEHVYKRMNEAFLRSLTAAEAVAKAWKNRALTVECLLQGVETEGSQNLPSYNAEEIIFGGRVETLLGNGSRKWDLLANGPRTETPNWMKWRIGIGQQGLPPRNHTPATSPVEAELPLHLPTPEEVWSISSAKLKDDDVFAKQAAEKEALDDQRKALERALQTKSDTKVLKDTESGTGSGQEVVFQGFNWESWRRKWYVELAPKAADLAKCGITTVWLPPPTTSVSPQGYMPADLYNLNSAYGTIDELKQCIEEMHSNGIQVLGDAVLNHRCAQKQSPNGIWNVFGGKLSWGPEAIVKDDPNFQGRGNPSSGDCFHAAPNIDHSQDFVRRDIIEWLKWLRTEIGYDGWRLDFVRGFWGGYVKDYIEATTPVFSIGEYWDSLSYEGGQVSYNQDAHRQRIVNWINATGGTSSAFDVTTKGILHSALHNEYWRLIDPQGKPPGVMGWWPSRAVTFLENHDTGSTQGHWPFPRDKLMQGYAYILTHPGTPVIFYDHFYDFGLHDQIAELIAARRRTGVTCRSPVKIFLATFDGYVALIGDRLLVKLGHLDWNPSKENSLIGPWERFLDKGSDFQLWEKKV